VLAIVPVRGGGAKSRLASLLAADERAELVRVMLERVLAACAGATAIERTLLVTPDPGLAPEGVGVLVDDGRGHPEAIALALGDPRARPGALVVMADCPLATAESLDALAAAARPLALAPSHDGGVNALALTPLDGFLPRFGVPAETMIAAAQAKGLEPAVVRDERLAFDVDRPGDLARL
jgi:2-phospho-L-lactate/phosphoenolpyruvate guanylyltransferase